ncbi:MAG: thermonuclease family protein [Lachnospiraceae bacterium]|nr:thermonuclease family protein [Lachnospiraceae bacterium]
MAKTEKTPMKEQKTYKYESPLVKARKKRRRKKLLLALFIVLLIAIPVLSLITWRDRIPFFQKEQNGETTAVSVLYVSDGDTILVEFPDGSKEHIRLLLIDAPESVHPDEEKNTEEGRQAAAFLKELLPVGTTVYLEYDTNERTFDRYGRMLAYVWLTETTSVESSYIKQNMVNAILLSKGYASYYPYDEGKIAKRAYRKVLEGIR